MTRWTAADSEGALITAVLAGDQSAFAVIMHKYQQPLLRVAESRLGRRDWAEDVVQDTFLCVYKSLHTYDSRFSFRTWLWTILLNQCRRHLKKRARKPFVAAWSDQRPTDEGSDEPVPRVSTDCPAQRLLAKEQQRQLQQLLTQLPSVQADAIRLRFYGGLKFHEIADAMSCSLSSAKNRVRWGLTQLSQLMDVQKLPMPVDSMASDQKQTRSD